MRNGIVAILIGLCVLAFDVSADQTIELYRADELVKSQSQAQRAAAAKHALERVIVRVSGQLDSIENPVVKQALSNAQEYVYEYSYLNTREQLQTASGEMVEASRLHLKFSPPLIERLLREANLPFWPSNRPNLLVWMVKNDGSSLQMATDAELREQLRERSVLRGLPLTLPVHDLEDHLAMPASGLWQVDEDAVIDASERYGADAILVVRYNQLPDGRYSGSWQLLRAEGDYSELGQADTEAAFVEGALDATADYLAGIYAISPSESGAASIAMEISNARHFGDFKNAERYLSSLALVRRVALYQLSNDGLVLKLYTEGSVEQLENTLALTQVLVPESSSVSLSDNRYLVRGSVDRPLRYRLKEVVAP